jgi:putative FmdB family regulatory protein
LNQGECAVPIYEYKCRKCHEITEQIQGYDDPGPKCPSCGGKTDKVMSESAFILKGTGWYKTDYAKSEASGGKGKKKAAPCAEGKAEGAPACAGCPKAAAGE